MARAVDTLRPGQVIIENVRSLLRVPADRPALGDVLRDLADLGYDADWETVPASAVGAPHRRDRIFIVAAAHAHRL
jgi:DNA (cytosine-5)-methyltransferase 1